MSGEPLNGPVGRLFDTRFLSSIDLPQDKPVKVIIESVTREEVRSDGKGPNKPVIALHFKGKSKMMVVNKTNAGLIRKALGSPDIADWIGKEITIHATTCNAFGDPNTPCIRVIAPKRYRVGGNQHG